MAVLSAVGFGRVMMGGFRTRFIGFGRGFALFPHCRAVCSTSSLCRGSVHGCLEGIVLRLWEVLKDRGDEVGARTFGEPRTSRIIKSSTLKRCTSALCIQMICKHKLFARLLYLNLILFLIKVVFDSHIVQDSTTLSNPFRFLCVKIWQHNILPILPLSLTQSEVESRF